MRTNINQKVSEKTLELNVGAEILEYFRKKLNYEKAFLRGLTQKEESIEGVDIFVHIEPNSDFFIIAFQFKAPFRNEKENRNTPYPYKFRINRKQHEKLHRLAEDYPNSVFYVFPYYSAHKKLYDSLPNLLADTWFLKVEDLSLNMLGDQKSKIIRCFGDRAKINPEIKLFKIDQIKLEGIPVAKFSGLFKENYLEPKEKNPWLLRGFKIMIFK